MLQRLKTHLLDLLFPRQCIGCRRSDAWLCEKCSHLVHPNEYQRCYICKTPKRYAMTCEEHLNNSRVLDRLLVCCHYEGNPILKKAIRTLKYHKKTEDITARLGEIMSDTLRKNLTVPSKEAILIPVPLHAKRQKERGFNQAELIATACVQIEPLKIKNLLERTRYTSAQAKTKGRQERLTNLKDAFRVTEKINPYAIHILVDDVTTTGSTLEECCAVLKQAGAREVWGLVLARN